MKFASWPVVTVAVVAAGVVVATAEEGDEGMLKALPTAKHSLAEGVRESSKAPNVALSAKFEMGDDGDTKGKLVLSVYAAKKGLTDDPWQSGLTEFAAAAAADKWAPGDEARKDGEDLAHAAQQETLLTLTTVTLADVVAKAEKAGKGTVVSATPMVRDRKAVFVVETAADGKVSERLFDLKTGEPVAAKTK
jgi:hypothetical protein